MPTTTGEYTVGFLATQFSLTGAIQVSRIVVDMSGNGDQTQFTLWLTNAIGHGTTQANVLLQSSLTFPAGWGVGVAAPANVFLSAGVYYIVLSSSQTVGTSGWVLASSVLSSSVGNITAQ